MDVGYTVQLLENQMKTIVNSIRQLEEVTDKKQKEVLLKPLLLQQTILQKMIDQEKLNVSQEDEATDIDGMESSSINVTDPVENGTVSMESAENRYALQNKDVEVIDQREIGESERRKRLVPIVDSTVEDILVVNGQAEIDAVVEKTDDSERLQFEGEEKLSMEQRMEKSCEEIEMEEAQKKLVEQRQIEIEEEKRRFEEQKRFIEDEKRKKRELERQKQVEEKNKLAAERLQEEIRKQKEYLKQKQILEEQWRIEKEKKEAEERKKKEDALRLRKQEELRLVEEEKKKMELQQKEIELERMAKEEEKKRLQEEVQKLKDEEKRRNEEKEAIKKEKEELKELERLRKELEMQKKIESEKLEKERREIDELKRQLKEQRELQEKDRSQRLKEEQLHAEFLPTEKQDPELLDNPKERKVEKRNDTGQESVDTIMEGSSSDEPQTKECHPNYGDTKSSGNIENDDDGGNTKLTHLSSTQSTTFRLGGDEKRHGNSKRKPSLNFVSSAIRSSDGDASKKPVAGLYAKIQQLTNVKPYTTNATNEKYKMAQNINRKDVGRNNVDNETTKEQCSEKTLDNAAEDDSKLQIVDTKESSDNELKEVQSREASKGLSDADSPGDEEDATKFSEKGDQGEAGETKEVTLVKVRDPTTEDRSQELKAKQAITLKPFSSNPSTAFKPQVFKPTSAFMTKHNGSSNAITNKIDTVVDKPQKSENGSSQLKEGESLKGQEQQPDLKDSTTQRGNDVLTFNAGEEKHTTDGDGTGPSRNKNTVDADMFKSKGMYLPGVVPASSATSVNLQQDNGKDGLQLDHTDLSFQSSLGSYRPKCISPDDLRSSLALERESKLEPSRNASSSAAILKNALDKKAPPKVLPKTLPKTLPKPGAKKGESPANIMHRENVDNRLKNFNQPHTDGRERKKEHISISAIPNRNLEISSGSISSNIMNRNIQHEERKVHGKSSDRGRILPNAPSDNLKSQEAVTSEPVQAPSLLRRLSQNSVSNDTASSCISPRDIQLNEPEQHSLDPAKEITKSGDPSKEAVSLNDTEDVDPVKLANYASIVDADENEKSQRDIVTVKKVGGLKIGFGRDKPQVFNV